MRLKLLLIFLVVFVLPGLGGVGYSAWHLADAYQRSTAGVRGTGKIVAYERQAYRARVGRRFCAVVEFQHAGETVKFTDDWCNTAQAKRPIGSVVNVIYNPEHPEASLIDDFGTLYGKNLFIGVICVPWLLLGIVLLVRVR
ncbi:MAG: DUF3592 domain-containing protein [Thermomonas sp.]|uniref:DUF3592 domain-containing protein n=1 Tax=Thermomonas sp. TaxID=1971895 RepID=UPI00262AECE0|nr:DUF3592 domain-containing protein [Thermomonas sp.]MCC7097446.1 DUF3592 domain-containing protein [Thermomonas sp.]